MIIRDFFKKKRHPATANARKHEACEKPGNDKGAHGDKRSKDHKHNKAHKQHRSPVVQRTPRPTASPRPHEKHENTLSALGTQLTQLAHSIKQDNQIKHAEQTDAIAAVHTHLAEVNNHLRKIALKQKETDLQLDEIIDTLQDDGSDVRRLLEAFLVCSTEMEHFYRFAAQNADSPLYAQAQMMWHAAKTAGKAAGVDMIDDSSVPFDIQRHKTESCECDLNKPNGYVLRTLKCGCTYKHEVIRRAMVVVNKWEDKP